MENTNIKNKTALVTGASSGIGEAIARMLAENGVKVALAARRKDRLDAIASDIKKNGGEALVVPTDVTKNGDCENAVSKTIAGLGQLDILVNDAGMMLLGPVAGAPLDEWEKMIHINLLGLLYMTHAALPHMKERKSGHIVNIASVAGRTTGTGIAVYNATKWAVVGFTDGLRKELVEDKTGIRTTLIEPGSVKTDLIGHNRPEILAKVMPNYEKSIKLEPIDIARAVLYAVNQPQHASVNELMIRPTEQMN